MTEPYQPYRNHWFGEPWPDALLRAPVCEDDRYQVPVPVGAPCLWCEEAIEESDRGERYSSGEYVHIECSMRNVVGNVAHLDGRCHHVGECNDILAGQTYRQQALDVWQYLVTQRRL